MNKVLIVTAHLDDFELGMGGTATKLCRENDVHLIVLCKGDRPGHESVGSPRKLACLDNCADIGITKAHLYGYSDTRLDLVSQTELCDLIHKHVHNIQPNLVYTHYNQDIHKDHCIVSNITRVACRMRNTSPVNELLEFSIPGSTEWGHTPMQFNLFEDISKQAEMKMKMISRYVTELRDPPDPISQKMIVHRDMYHGSLCGYNHAEVFKVVFKR